MFILLLFTIGFSYVFDDLLQITDMRLKSYNDDQIQQLFTTGLIDGFFSDKQTTTLMKSLKENHPYLFPVYSNLGPTTQGRTINTLKMIYNNQDNMKHASVLLVGMLHGSKDLVSTNFIMMTIYNLYHSLAKGDPYIQRLMQSVDLTLLPILDVDTLHLITTEYEETYEIIDVEKNLHSYYQFFQKTCDQYQNGVDLQRNFPYKFGADDVGSSSDQCNKNYRGESSLSEYESQAFDKLIQSNNFDLIVVFTGNEAGFIAPQSQYQSSFSDNYQVLLNGSIEKYNLTFANTDDTMTTRSNGDLCENYQFSKETLCVYINLGKGNISTILDKYYDLPIDILTYIGPSLQLKYISNEPCKQSFLICDNVELHKQQGYVINFKVVNGGLLAFQQDIKITIQLQASRYLIQIMNISSQTNGGVTTYNVKSVFNKTTSQYSVTQDYQLQYNASIHFALLVVRFNDSDEYLNEVLSVPIIIQLMNANKAEYSQITMTLDTEPNSNITEDSSGRLFPNRTESFIILLIFGGFTGIFIVLWMMVKVSNFYKTIIPNSPNKNISVKSIMLRKLQGASPERVSLNRKIEIEKRGSINS